MSSSNDVEPIPDCPDDTSDASPIFGTVMVLWFLAFGVGAGYFAVIRYLGGWPLLSVQVLGLAGAMVVNLIVVGVVAKMITWRSPTVPEDTPWKLRPAWRSPTIKEDLYFRTVSPSSAVLFGVAGWGTGGAILYFNYWLPENPDSGVLLFLIFPLAFSVPAVLCLRRTWHRWTYGTSTLVMKTMPGRLGRLLNLRLQSSVAPSDARDDIFHAKLTCYHRSSHRRSSGSIRVSWLQKWQTETEVHEYFSSEARSGTASDGNVEVPISFDLPADAPPSTPEKKSERIAWILEVSAARSGLNYQAYFEIPVFEPEEAGETASTQTSASSQYSSQAPSAQDSVSTANPTPSDEPMSLEGPASAQDPASTDELNVSGEPASPDPSSPEPSGAGSELAPDAPSDDSFRDAAEDRTTDDPADDEVTVRCDNCRSTVKASASTCPACGADLDSGWFS